MDNLLMVRTSSISQLPTGSCTSVAALLARGYSRSAINHLSRSGVLLPEMNARGVYRIEGRELSQHHDLLVVALYAPGVTFCLLTALMWHGLRGSCPDIWLSVPASGRVPDLKQLSLACIRPRVAPAAVDVMDGVVEDVPMRFTSLARTVADCFQYRTRVGLDVALAALQAAHRNRAASMDDIWRCAQSGGVADVMLPYMESLG